MRLYYQQTLEFIMLIRSLLLILFFSTSAFAQREILEDPTFKKKDKYWMEL